MTPINHSTHTEIEKSISEIDFKKYIQEQYETLNGYYSSPHDWRDQVLYFLLPDRFSDGKEIGHCPNPEGVLTDYFLDNDGNTVSSGSTPPFNLEEDPGNIPLSQWFDNGGTWCGGTLQGLTGKLGYLKRMGITTIWLGPIFKQCQNTWDSWDDCSIESTSYHGYGIQNFIDVDPHFGTRQDLKNLVTAAHNLGIYVLMDIVLNHAGDVFDYTPDRYPVTNADGSPSINPKGKPMMDPRWDGTPHKIDSKSFFRTASGKCALPIGPNLDPWPDGAVWPVELQEPGTFTGMGRICNWDNEQEYLNGDFCTLKDIFHGTHEKRLDGKQSIDHFDASPALKALCDIYKFWIAYADVDGFRVDTVKHIEIGASRYFSVVIKEFAEELGKENFLLLAEIAGGREHAYDRLAITGLDAALAISDEAINLELVTKGLTDPFNYFKLYRNSSLINQGSHTWFGKHIVNMLNDHDHIVKPKRRYCGDPGVNGLKHLKAALAFNLTTIGIPCIYYGTEAGFDGNGHDLPEDQKNSDRLLRECLFGGAFGSYRSANVHFFNEESDLYQTIKDICALRKKYIELRRGRQYLRPISGTGNEGEFSMPRMLGDRLLSIVPWSRIYNSREMLLAINTDSDTPQSAWVTVDYDLHTIGDILKCIYCTSGSPEQYAPTVEARNGKSIYLTLPPASFVILK